MRYFCVLFILPLFLLAGCGASGEAEAENAIQAAVSELTRGNCSGAISQIESVPYQPLNVRFVKTYASAYACRAGYSTPTFFQDDLPKIGDPSLFGSLARFSTSSTMNEPREDSYMDLQVALNALLYAGDIPRNRDPTSQRRVDRLGADNVKDLHSQLLYLLLVQLGKYNYFYGDSDNGGNKDGCFLTYDGTISLEDPTSGLTVTIDNYLTSGAGGDCGAGEVGHPDLAIGADINIERACQGLVLFNNMMDVLPRVIDSITGDELDDLTDFVTEFEDAKGSLDVLPTKPLNILSQDVCLEKYDGEPVAQEDLQIFFVLFFEGLFP